MADEWAEEGGGGHGGGSEKVGDEALGITIQVKFDHVAPGRVHCLYGCRSDD